MVVECFLYVSTTFMEVSSGEIFFTLEEISVNLRLLQLCSTSYGKCTIYKKLRILIKNGHRLARW